MKYLIALILIAIATSAEAQYVSSLVNQRVQDDQTAIALDKADIHARYADINVIINDAQAQDVTSQSTVAQAIEAAQVQTANNNLAGKSQVVSN